MRPLYTLIVAFCAVAPASAIAQTISDPGPHGLMRWFDQSTLPFIPVPEIGVDPNGGTTLGLLPTWLVTDDRAEIRKIIAPDVIYNSYFGVGVTGRLYSFQSDDTQWSVIAGVKQHVERGFNYEYQTGRLRDARWSFIARVVYDRNGTARFYGIGNETPMADETNYTLQQKYVQTSVGLNLSRTVQISYTLRARAVDVQPGSLGTIPSIETRFSGVSGLGVGHETLNRIAIIYDTRDDPTVPTRGGAYVIYGGIAAKQGVVNASQYSVAGFDARQLWTPSVGNTIAAHLSMRFMPGKSDVPFWSLSNLGGDDSSVGEAQPLRGFGTGRFEDRDALSGSVEYRKRVLETDAISTHINVEVTPFLDVGKVYAHSRSSPFSHLHRVAGVGFRGVASPFVVGYVDIGYGSEGTAIFTGINYPF